MKKCPKCGSRHIAPILYGMPAFDEEMARQIKNKELVLGGCCISGREPRYHCFGCGRDVGTPPIFVRNGREEDYRDIVTGIVFSDGGYFGGYQEISIKKSKGKIMLEVIPAFSMPESFLQREMTEKEWNRLLDRIYSKLYVHEWKKNFIDPTIMDGEQWELTLKLTGGRQRRYSGSNAFPPYWRELKSTFRPFFKEAGIKL